MIENQELPFVSALLVTRNEIKYIEESFLSLVNQTYPKSRYEIIAVDGKSDDGTKEKLLELAKKYSDENLKIKVFDNEKKILASGWNIGIKNSQGSYVTRIDAHAKVENDFIEKNVETVLEVKDAWCVGGKLVTKSLDGDDETVSYVLSSPFGIGNSSFRVSDKKGYADTAVYGLYKRETFDKIGYFDERFVRNQDLELHGRIKKARGKFFFNPEIKCYYYARNSVKKMMKQAFGNGKWNMVLAKKDASSLSLRHMIPFAFVLYLLLSGILGIFFKPLWILESAVILLHLCLGIVFAVKKTKKITQIIKMPFLFFLLHLSYGNGYFAGLVKRKIK